MNIDAILESFARNKVDAILIGGMNFLLQHQPVLTFDVDFWVRDTDENLSRVSEALHELGAEWGRDDKSWRPVPSATGWLRTQSMFCMTSPHGAIDIFREVAGLEGQYDDCRTRGADCLTSTGIPYVSLSNQDMLACQLALPEAERRLDRIAFLENLLKKQL
jgi:hypothetical protein